ncbi:MAG: peptidase T [Bacteroidaceae bacterium]|nr:peptidase T [Bacteroidaceae bacterium]
MIQTVTERFLRYVRFDTQSDPDSTSTPSTYKQYSFLCTLEKELHDIGIAQTRLYKEGLLFATIPANTDKNLPKIGLLAHVDTSPECCGKDVKPQIVEYKGGDIVLNKEKNILLSPAMFPVLKSFVGKHLIVTDGTTLLGADDKAGVAEIITAVEQIMHSDSTEHGIIQIAFTPDEEIGRGTENFNVKEFNADWAYTVDGGDVGELEYETFNAAHAKITIKGIAVHPGYAKDTMVNAVRIAGQIIESLPKDQCPENTCGYDGFFHPISIEGGVGKSIIDIIIRDHNRDILEQRKEVLRSIVENINSKYGKETASLEIKDEYYNMKETFLDKMFVVERAKRAMEQAGISPVISPVRGGTDGSFLSFMGLPCPNIFAGGINFHGPYEFIPIESMEKAVETIKNIIVG